MSLPATLTAQLWHWAETTPDTVALRHKGKGLWREFTWREFLLSVATTARALYHTGIKRGDFVSILADNRPEWLYVDLANTNVGHFCEHLGASLHLLLANLYVCRYLGKLFLLGCRSYAQLLKTRTKVTQHSFIISLAVQ